MSSAVRGIARVRRHVLRAEQAILALGDFSELFGEYRAHVRRWDLPLDPLGEVMMHQALAGAALQLCFRPTLESTAWTVNFDAPPLNVFVTGGGEENEITGRIFTEGVKTVGESRLYVQRKRPQYPLGQSNLAVEGLDLLQIFEQFYRESEQIHSCFLELSSTEMAMVQGLPGSDPDWVGSLDREAIRDLARGSTEPLEERHYHFHCGCTGDRMAGALFGSFRLVPERLFQGDPGVEALCPRCGARWWIDRELFDSMAIRGPGPEL